MQQQSKMSKSNTLSKVNKIAHSLKAKFSLTWKVAIKWAWREFKRYSPVVKIEFIKKSTGELREAVATQLRVKEAKDGTLSIQFWSVLDNGFRKAIIDNILSIQPHFTTA